MSFFGNIKRITTSTAKAISNGAELLNELAEGGHKSSELLLLKTKASKMDNDINHLVNNSADPQEISEKRQALAEKYNEIIQETLGSEREEYVRKNKSLENEIIISKIIEIKQRVETKEQVLSNQNFKLAITEIHKLENIQAELEHLLRLTKTGQHEVIHQKALGKLKHNTILIADLQEKRHEETFSTYPSGNMKSKSKLYDGKYHGLTEYWYEGGLKEKEISFSHGVLSDTSRYWRNDGTLLSEITNQPKNGSFSHSIFARNGIKIMEFVLKNKMGYVDIWLWDGSFVCRGKMNDNKISRASFLIKAGVRKNVWVSLYRARKPGLQKDQFNDMTETVKIHTSFFNELVKYMTHRQAS